MQGLRKARTSFRVSTNVGSKDAVKQFYGNGGEFSVSVPVFVKLSNGRALGR
jgi:hypothetical protein